MWILHKQDHSRVEKLETVPAESVAHHALLHDFSRWLRAHGEISLANQLRPRLLEDYASVEGLRDSGVVYGPPQVELAGVRAFKDRVVGKLTGGLEQVPDPPGLGRSRIGFARFLNCSGNWRTPLSRAYECRWRSRYVALRP